ESSRPGRLSSKSQSRLRRLLGFVGLLGFLGAIRAVRVVVAFGALAAWRALGLVASLVASLVAANAGHDVAGRQHLDKLAHRRRELAAALVDDRQRTQKAPFLELEHPQSAARDLVLDGHPRHDCASKANLDGALDGLDVVEFERVGRLDAVLAQDSIGGLSGWDIALVADKLLTLQLSDTYLRVLGQRIVGRHGEH